MLTGETKKMIHITIWATDISRGWPQGYALPQPTECQFDCKPTCSMYISTAQRRRKQIKSGWARIPARSAGKFFFFCAPPLFCRAHLVWGGTAHTRVGTKMGSHSTLFVRKEMAKESTF